MATKRKVKRSSSKSTSRRSRKSYGEDRDVVLASFAITASLLMLANFVWTVGLSAFLIIISIFSIVPLIQYSIRMSGGKDGFFGRAFMWAGILLLIIWINYVLWFLSGLF